MKTAKQHLGDQIDSALERGEDRFTIEGAEFDWVLESIRASDFPKDERVTAELCLVLAGLRHAYWNLINGAVKDQKSFADGLISTQIKRLEKIIGF